MTKIQDYFRDDYDRETLLVPALAVILPAVIVGALLGLHVNVVFGFAIMGIEIAATVLWLMAGVIRDAGRSLESKLFNGCMPTTLALRLGHDPTFETKARRTAIERLSGVTLCNRKREREQPLEADQRIKHAVDLVKEQMRDPQLFKLLRRELKSYGQWRNLVAVRWWGVAISSASAAVAIIVLVQSANHKQLPLASCIVAASGIIYWLFVVRPNRVISSADRYKEQYFKSLSVLESQAKPAADTTS